MVVVSHLFLSLRKSFRGRFDSCESNLPLFGTIYFPTAPISLAEGASASVAAADSISTAAQEKQYDQDTAVVAAKTVSTADSISIATAAKQKDDPENGIASIIVVCVSTSIVFASASTVCSCYITHVFIPPELIYTS